MGVSYYGLRWSEECLLWDSDCVDVEKAGSFECMDGSRWCEKAGQIV